MSIAGMNLPPNLGDLTYLRQKVAENGPDSWYADQLRSVQGIGEKTGADIYANLSGGMHNRYGQTDRAVQANYASQHLAEAGIPGIRYLDQGSRQKAEDIRHAQEALDLEKRIRPHAENIHSSWQDEVTRLQANPLSYNYVVTDPSKLDILAKYGVAGAAAVPVMSGAFDQSRYEAQ